MKIDIARPAIILVSCMALGGCHFNWGRSHAQPSGQIVATVGDHEITRRQLQAELAGFVTHDRKQQKAAEQAALQLIVKRTILADAAADQGVDHEPEFAIQKDRLLDNLLAQGLEAKIAAQIPPPTQEEAEALITSNSDIFAERKIFEVDQIQTVRPPDFNIIRQMQPLKTLDEIEALLSKNHIVYHRGTASIDAVGQDPRLVKEILRLPSTDVFMFSTNNELLINQRRATKVVPLVGKPALKYALALLKRQHNQDAVTKGVNAILAKAAGSVRYNKDYLPVPPPKQTRTKGAPI